MSVFGLHILSEFSSHFIKYELSATDRACFPTAAKIVFERSKLEFVEWLLFWIFVSILAWVPLWLGSNRFVPWGVNACLLGMTVLCYELFLVVFSRPHSVGIRVVLPSAVLFGGVIIWCLIQMSLLVPATWTHPIWAMAGDGLDQPIAGSISINRDLTSIGAVHLLTAACSFWLSLQLCRNSDRARILVQAIGIITAVYALYGIIVAPFGAPIFWFDVAPSDGVVRSTFVSRNTFATYSGIGVLCNAALLLRLYRRQSGGGSVGNRMSHFILRQGRHALWIIGGFVLCLAGLLLTGSRAGIMSSLTGIIALILLTFSGKKRRIRDHFEVIVFMVVAVSGAFFFFGNLFAGRIGVGGIVDSDRMAVYRSTLQSIMDSPILGFGYGTFIDVFPMYRDRSVGTYGLWDHAHNTYLEVLQGLGIIAGAMLIGSIACLGLNCFIGVVKRKTGLMPVCVALSALVLVGVHALVDFSLEVQAITVTFMALLGAGVAQAESSKNSVAD